MKTFKTKLKLNNKQRTRKTQVDNSKRELNEAGILQKADNCNVIRNFYKLERTVVE